MRRGEPTTTPIRVSGKARQFDRRPLQPGNENSLSRPRLHPRLTVRHTEALPLWSELIAAYDAHPRELNPHLLAEEGEALHLPQGVRGHALLREYNPRLLPGPPQPMVLSLGGGGGRGGGRAWRQGRVGHGLHYTLRKQRSTTDAPWSRSRSEATTHARPGRRDIPTRKRHPCTSRPSGSTSNLPGHRTAAAIGLP